jgi:hypothetical protein
MIVNGIDLDGLAEDAASLDIPPTVKGRIVHIDADFLAYQVTATRADGTDLKTYEDMKHNAEAAVTTLRELAGAEFVHLHLTPSTSNKGGRYAAAIQRKYQGNREDKPKPEYLGIMREWLAKRYNGTLHQFCEADDGMSSAQYAALAEGNGNLSIIASKDKDLSMVPGLHLDWDTGEVIDADVFGYVDLVTKVSKSGAKTTKLKGFGQKFFWAQMLIGDTADNIKGLPSLDGAVLNAIKPTAAVTKAIETINDPSSTDKAIAKAQAVLDERKSGPCGPATAILILDKLTSNKQAFHTIRGLYQRTGITEGYKHWLTGDTVHWGQVFLSEAQLLWMRRDKDDPQDVAKWLREVNAV